MKFNIGDKVRDDFEMPVLITELILDASGSYNKPANERVLTSNKPDTKHIKAEIIPSVVKENSPSAFFIAFVPVDQKKITDSSLKLYFINDSNYSANANILLQYGALYVSHPKTIQANTKVEIKLLAKNDLNDIDSITVQMILHKIEPHKILPAISFESKINPIKFFKDSTYTENDFFDELAHIITVYDESNSNQTFPEIKLEELKKAFQEKEHENVKVNKKPVSQTSKSTEAWEIDLHINELLDDISGMTAKEIIDYQMDYFRKEMQNAINERVKKVIFIHGKGDGVLKSEIRQELKTNYRKYQFQDASFQQYGFGATAVYIN